MRRRALLRGTVALGAIGLAGCLSDGGSESTPTQSPTPEPPQVDSTNVETTNTDCGSGTDGGAASLAADASNHRLTITGTVPASNPCHLAELTAVELADGSLTVTVGTVLEDENQACADCVGAVDYEATAHLTAGLSADVVVNHESFDETTEVASESVEL